MQSVFIDRAEYRNAIRDLVGVDYALADDFPGDDVGYGFDNIGDVLSLPPLLMEKYLDAAEAIIGEAICTPPPPQLFELERSSREGEWCGTAKAVLGRFASRAYRRPIGQSELERLANLASQVKDNGGSFEASMQVAMQAVLISPYFLFRVERSPEPGSEGVMPQVYQYELATRISYFLWSGMPDDELLRMAHRGQLRDRRRLLEKVGRMIKSPKASRFVDNFASQWLQLRNLENVQPDARIYRGFDDEVREAMRVETLMFFSEVMRNNLPVTELLSADFTYMNETLARFYGIKDVRGNEFRKVSLAGTPRGGLLTQASVLTVISNPTRTSPVKRGKWILDNLLNTPPPPAPPNIPELEKGPLVGSLREGMEQHRSNPACAARHNMMDPLGVALENFDAVGRWRTRDGRDEIDASGSMSDGTSFDGVSYWMGAAGARQVPYLAAALLAAGPQLLWVHCGAVATETMSAVAESGLSAAESGPSRWLGLALSVVAAVLLSVLVPRHIWRQRARTMAAGSMEAETMAAQQKRS